MSERIIVPDVYGVETEYSCMLTFPGDVNYEMVGSCHSDTVKLGLYDEPKSMGGDHIEGTSIVSSLVKLGILTTSDGMLSNGGRFYIDPSGPEYATPETTTASEAVQRNFDGDSILYSIFANLRERGVLEGFQVNRRVVDHNRTSRGVHLNTTTSLPPGEVPSLNVINALATLNVVKGSIFGSGGLLIDEDGETHFHHSPRLSLTDKISAQFIHHDHRPLVRYPFKPDGDNLARVETVTSDALNFGWPLRASLIVTNSLIRLLELRQDIKIPYLHDAVSSAEIVGRHGYDCILTVEDDDGNCSYEEPLKILNDICELILKTNETEQFLSTEALQVLPEVVDLIDRMSRDPMSVATQVESVARAIAMRKKMEQKHVLINSETMCRFDYAWDWIGRGIAQKLRDKKLAGWQGFDEVPSPHIAHKNQNIPPKDTRASIRGDLILDSMGNIELDWTGRPNMYLHPLDNK